MQTSTNTLTECEFCGADLQPIMITIGDREITVGYQPCSCHEAQHKLKEAEAEQRRNDEQERLKRRQRRLATTGIPPRYWNATTDRKDLVETAKEHGLWIQGGFGVGKTELACAIGIELFDQGFKVAFIKAADLVDMLSQFNDNLEAIKSIQSYDVLIIDDLGMDETRDWTDRRLRRAIDARWDSNKPTIFTSNFTKQQLAEHMGQSDEMNAEAVISRIFGMTIKVEMDGPDWRVKR